MIENLLEINVKKPMKIWIKVAVLDITPEEAQNVNSPLEMDKYYKEKDELFYYAVPGDHIKINDIKFNNERK